MSNAVGRNDPCPCGSGEKYKRCCQAEGGSTAATSTASRTMMIVIGGVVLLGLVFIAVSLFAGGAEGACPPGQTWSAAHGHCH